MQHYSKPVKKEPLTSKQEHCNHLIYIPSTIIIFISSCEITLRTSEFTLMINQPIFRSVTEIARNYASFLK